MENEKSRNVGVIINSSFAILIITTILFGPVLLSKNSEIRKIESEIAEISENISRHMYNAGSNSNQFVKISSTYGAYLVLLELNSTYKSDLMETWKNEYIQLIVTTKAGDVSSKALKALKLLEIQELDKEAEKAIKGQIRTIKRFEDKKKQKEEVLRSEIASRDKLQYWTFIGQIFGLLLGFLANIRSDKMS